MGGRIRKRGTANSARNKSPIDQSLASMETIVTKSPAHRALAKRTLSRLHNLSNRIGMSLRRHGEAKIRIVASLLAVGLLALIVTACDDGSDWNSILSPPSSEDVSVVQTPELTAEVATGLPPNSAQTYQVRPESITRDHRGIYSFDWFDPTSNNYRTATVTGLRIAQATGTQPELSMSDRGDPILFLPEDMPVSLVWPGDEEPPRQPAPGEATPTPFANDRIHHYYGGYYGYYRAPWYPMRTSSGSTAPSDPTATRPAYRDPASGSAMEAGRPLIGSVPSEAPKPLTERTISRIAVSGMNRGTGAGRAVSGRASSGVSGMSRGTGAGTAATGRSGSSSGVRAPSSSGFSAGRGGGSGGSS